MAEGFNWRKDGLYWDLYLAVFMGCLDGLDGCQGLDSDVGLLLWFRQNAELEFLWPDFHAVCRHFGNLVDDFRYLHGQPRSRQDCQGWGRGRNVRHDLKRRLYRCQSNHLDLQSWRDDAADSWSALVCRFA